MEEKKEIKKFDWRPILIFYARTTGWILLPLLVALFLGNILVPGFLLIFMIGGFVLTCFGIYRELRRYKRVLDKIDQSEKKI